jgi:carotenoid cleavage dioxygenase-like enzyme
MVFSVFLSVLTAAPTFTAHPKPDPETGELITWGYMAKGDATTDVAYYLFDKNGKKLEECWFHAPYAGLMHDVAITPNYVVFQMYPLACDLERIKAGGLYFEYDEKLPMYLLLLPKRNPKPADIKWFEWEPDHFEGHVSNAFEKNGKVYVDFPVFKGNVFNFFPDKDGKAPPRHALTCRFPRFELDPHTTNLKIPEPEWLSDITGEFSRIDERFQGR